MAKRKPQASQGAYPEYDALNLDQCHGERRSLGLQMQAVGAQYRALRIRHDYLSTRIRTLKSGDTGIGISDHAVVRYLERIKGMDMQAIRDEIRSHAALKTVEDKPDQIASGEDVSFAIYDRKRIATVWQNG